MGEFELIKKYLKQLTKNSPGSLDLNDDVFFNKKNKLVISVDTYNEGIHFLNFKYPNLVIKKILRSSISDLICKGVKPKFYFISASGNKKYFTKKNLNLLSNTLKKEQKKFNIKLSGGDTTNSNKLSFSFTLVGFSNYIIKRNNAKVNDDIYVTGNIGDSFVGLSILKNKIKLNKKFKNYFVKKYFSPDIPYKYYKCIKRYANTSIDVSDGLIGDMNKLINNQKLSYKINLDYIPISSYLRKYVKNYNKKKERFLFNGDDYQILFTSSKKNRKFIKNISKNMNQKVTIIGKINNRFKNNRLLLNNKAIKLLNYQGYSHKF